MYRLILFIYPIVVPVLPNVPGALLAFLRVLLPTGLFFLSRMYAKRSFTTTRRRTYVNVVSTTLALVILTGFMMLIFCRFRYGFLIVTSESMSGAIEYGDAIIYEEYDGQVIETDAVIVFQKDKNTIIHRVIDIEWIDGTTRYYTQGDANSDAD